MVKDENRHLQEWLAFHFMVGATKIVIYDDNQGLDGLAQVAAPFGKRVIIHNLAAMPDLPAELHPIKLMQAPRRPRKVGQAIALVLQARLLAFTRTIGIARIVCRGPKHTWPERCAPLHILSGLHNLLTALLSLQNWALRHCGQTYGGGTQQGWLAAITVDEYIFPCDSGSPSVGHAFQSRMASATPSTFALHLECLKFGFNDMGRPLLPGELRIQAHSRRAPYEQLEPLVYNAQRSSLTECWAGVWPYICSSAGSRLRMYRSHEAAAYSPSRQVSAPLAGVNRTWSRTSGVCCNHYMLRSAQELGPKLGCTKHYADPHPRLWYGSVSDTLAMRFVPSLKLALQQPSAQAVEARPGG